MSATKDWCSFRGQELTRTFPSIRIKYCSVYTEVNCLHYGFYKIKHFQASGGIHIRFYLDDTMVSD